MPRGFSVAGKTSQEIKQKRSSSPRELQKNHREQTHLLQNSLVSFLESEADHRTRPSSISIVPRDLKRPEYAVLPPRPRTPGEILPDLLTTEISRYHEKFTIRSDIPEPKISDADKFTLEGKQHMTLPDTNATATPETTMIHETSTPPGKRHINYTLRPITNYITTLTFLLLNFTTYTPTQTHGGDV